MLLQRLLRILAIVTAISSYLVILLGVLVTTTGSGRGCGNSWPFCHGQIIPGTLSIAGVIEYGHRILSSADGFLILILTLGTWVLYRKDFRAKLFAFLSLLFVVIQGALGAVTVVFEGTLALNWILSVHFGLSLIALASVVLLTIRLFQLGRTNTSDAKTSVMVARGTQVLFWGLAVYTYIVVYTGALVEHTGAVAACGYNLPGCGSTYLPGLNSLAGIQVLHRYAAGLLWFGVLAAVIVVVRHYRERRDLVQAVWWAFALISLQAASGIVNVLTTGQMLAALIHTTLISIFFSVLCYLCVAVGWPRTSRSQEQKSARTQVELTSVS